MLIYSIAGMFEQLLCSYVTHLALSQSWFSKYLIG